MSTRRRKLNRRRTFGWHAAQRGPVEHNAIIREHRDRANLWIAIAIEMANTSIGLAGTFDALRDAARITGSIASTRRCRCGHTIADHDDRDEDHLFICTACWCNDYTEIAQDLTSAVGTLRPGSAVGL
ncbi:MAG: hypothetical protein ABJB03_00435 [Rhodoglobus sp.]